MTTTIPDVSRLLVRVDGYSPRPSTHSGSWVALVEPGLVDVEVNGLNAGQIRRPVRCPAAGEVAAIELRPDELERAAPIAAPERVEVRATRTATLSAGIGYFPDSEVASITLGATADLAVWSRFAMVGQVIAAEGEGFVDGFGARQAGFIGYLGPSLRYEPATRIWLSAGGGIVAGVFVGGGDDHAALRPGFTFCAGYWFARAWNVSLDAFGFVYAGSHAGSVSLMLGTGLR